MKIQVSAKSAAAFARRSQRSSPVASKSAR